MIPDYAPQAPDTPNPEWDAKSVPQHPGYTTSHSERWAKFADRALKGELKAFEQRLFVEWYSEQFLPAQHNSTNSPPCRAQVTCDVEPLHPSPFIECAAVRSPIAKDVNLVHSVMAAITLRRAQTLVQLTSQEREADLADTRSDVIHLPRFCAVTSASRGEDGTRGTHRTTLEVAHIAHSIDKRFRGGFKLPCSDVREAPWATAAYANLALTSNMMSVFDDSIFAYVNGLAAQTLTSHVDEFTEANSTRLDGTGVNGNAGAVGLFSYGAPGAVIPKSGEPSNATARDYLCEFIRCFRLRLTRRDVFTRSAVSGDARESDAYAVFPPELVNVLRDDIINRGSLDDWRRHTIFADLSDWWDVPPKTVHYEGTLNGVTVLSSNAIPAPDSDADGVYWHFWAATPAALLFSKRPIWSFMCHDRDSGFLKAGLGFSFGLGLKNRDLLVKGRIATCVS